MRLSIGSTLHPKLSPYPRIEPLITLPARKTRLYPSEPDDDGASQGRSKRWRADFLSFQLSTWPIYLFYFDSSRFHFTVRFSEIDMTISPRWALYRGQRPWAGSLSRLKVNALNLSRTASDSSTRPVILKSTLLRYARSAWRYCAGNGVIKLSAPSMRLRFHGRSTKRNTVRAVEATFSREILHNSNSPQKNHND